MLYDKDTGKITDKGVSAAIAWIEQHGSSVCEACRQSRWNIEPKVFNIIDNSMSSSVPLIVLVCKNCGNVRMYSAMVVGIVKQSDSVSDSTAE